MSRKTTLLPGEEVVMSSDKDVLTLTTQRVRYQSTALGRSTRIGITLDSVASCGLVTKSFPIILLLAAITLIGAFVEDDAQGLLLLATALLGIAYLATRRSVISIASNGGDTILVPVQGMSHSSSVEFLEAVEREKLKRVRDQRGAETTPRF